MRYRLLIICTIVTFISCSDINADGKKDHINFSNVQKQIIDSNTNGLIKEYYPSGALKGTAFYINGKENGKSTSYYESGKVHIEAEFKNDSLVGEFKMYYSNGQINSVEYFHVAGETVSKVWFDNGQLRQVGKEINGKMQGQWINFYKSGKIASIENYDNNKRDGIWIYLSEAGDTTQKDFYKNSELINTEYPH